MKETDEYRGAVVITGASRGLGREMADYLSARGFRVFAGCRRPEAFAAPGAGRQDRMTPLRLDVTDAGSIAAAVETVSGAVGEEGLAGLVNNAGVAAFGPVEQVPVAVVEDLFRVNVVGLVAVTQQFLPLLRKSRGRVVNISSINGRLPTPFTGIYSASKFALEALSDALRAELLPWGISVSVVQPGAFATGMRAHGVQRWAEDRRALSEQDRALYRSRFDQTRRLIQNLDAGAADPREVSEAVFEALTDVPPETRYPVGEDAEQLMELATLPDAARDEALLQVWDQSS